MGIMAAKRAEGELHGIVNLGCGRLTACPILQAIGDAVQYALPFAKRCLAHKP
jgi:hypothetical protein